MCGCNVMYSNIQLCALTEYSAVEYVKSVARIERLNSSLQRQSSRKQNVPILISSVQVCIVFFQGKSSFKNVKETSVRNYSLSDTIIIEAGCHCTSTFCLIRLLIMHLFCSVVLSLEMTIGIIIYYNSSLLLLVLLLLLLL